MNILSVSELNEQIKSLLESHFTQIFVEGEVSRATYHESGHLYFTLKDERSAIRCVMFRSDLRSVPFRVEHGQRLIVGGRIGLYTPRGEYQIYAKELHPAGVGSLQLAFEQLKRRLEAQGYFDKRRPLPQIVRSMALVTSKTGAALQDMLRIATRRWPLVRIYVIDTLVQGKEAAPSIVKALEVADELGVDVVVVGRGGGSLEDLWAFNEEEVAHAIYRMKTPVVSAVGHEIDYVISDFVADHRAPTPSAAMELVLPDREEWLMGIDALMERFEDRIASILHHKGEALRHMEAFLRQQSPKRKLEFFEREIASLAKSLEQTFGMGLLHKERAIPQLRQGLDGAIAQRLQSAASELTLVHNRLQMAYEAKKLPQKSAQIVKNGRAVALAALEVGDRVELQDMEYRAQVIVDAKTKI